MTLIEIMVALSIAVVLFGAVIMGVGALTGVKAKEASTQLAGTIRALYDTAALSGKTCRLVFQLTNPKSDDGEVSWRAECAKSGVTAGAKREDEIALAKEKSKDKVRDDDSRFGRLDTEGNSLQALQAREKNRVDDAATFAEFSNEEVAQHELPSGVKVEVWTQKQREAIRSGPAYLYFFPQGYTERAQIWVKQGTNVWTLTVSPLTGKTVIHAEDLKVPNT